MSQCIFCGKPANSREHLWPEWTLKLGNPRHSITGRRPGKPEIVIPGPDAELKARIVCKVDCNEGWMSTQERRAAPIMKPMALDLSVPLDAAQQEVIAKWAIKTAMVFEGSRREEAHFVSVEDRKAMLESLTEPLLTGVWIGRFPSPTTHLSYRVELIDKKDKAVVGLVWVIKICALLMQVLTLGRDPRFGYVMREDPRLPWATL